MASANIYIAIPAMDELDTLPLTLQDLKQQVSAQPFEVHICVNQPENYWQTAEKRHICEHNLQLLEKLNQWQELPLEIMDYCSPGKGWTGKRLGVGWARKVLFDNILSKSKPEDIIISLDSDTRVRPNYVQSILDNFAAHPRIPAISVPYYHPLTGTEANDRAILRYELYMRNYIINLYQIGSPFSFTAVGSAIAMRAGALTRIGGITPVKSGEDFYLLQKFRKMAPISNYNEEMVYPAARFSDRVFFGTGPALIKGHQGIWDSYPIYPHDLFEAIEETYQLLPELWQNDVKTPFLEFLQNQFKDNNLWQSIRKNVKDLPHFEKAFHEKADGLRILQYLRQELDRSLPEEANLYRNLSLWAPNEIPHWMNDRITFSQLRVEQLDELRNILLKLEMSYRKKDCQIQ